MEISGEPGETPVTPKCTTGKNGEYYDNNGNQVTKEEYEKACSSENPQTGSAVSYVIIVGGIALAVAAFITLVPGVTLLKSIFHRPRFRSIIATDYGVEFHNWWVRCGNYKQYMEVFNLPKEEFKSFPSGHTGAAAVLIIVAPFLPMLDEKYQKLQLPLIYGALAWTLLVAFTRMLVGAHFLSDISMGAILAVVCMLIGNEILIHLKTLNPKPVEEEPVQQPEA